MKYLGIFVNITLVLGFSFGDKMAVDAVDPEIVDTLLSVLQKLKGTESSAVNSKPKKGKAGKAAPAKAGVDTTDINSCLQQLYVVLTEIASSVQDLKEQVEKSAGAGEIEDSKTKKLVREQGDELDECRQRSMKGNLILTSPSIPASNKVCLIKTDDKLREDEESLSHHVLGLIQKKYAVTVPEEDVQALHRLPNGSVIVRFWNRRPGSAWCKIVDGIKSGKNKDLNFYANFHLTRKRNGILYEVCQLKKAGKISKFFTDENGQISVKIGENGTKIKVTYVAKNKDEAPKTLTKEEILELLDD